MGFGVTDAFAEARARLGFDVRSATSRSEDSIGGQRSQGYTMRSTRSGHVALVLACAVVAIAFVQCVGQGPFSVALDAGAAATDGANDVSIIVVEGDGASAMGADGAVRTDGAGATDGAGDTSVAVRDGGDAGYAADAMYDSTAADSGSSSGSDASALDSGNGCSAATPVLCGEACIDPMTSLTYCGATGSCTGYSSCQSSQVCTGGKCAQSWPRPTQRQLHRSPDGPDLLRRLGCLRRRKPRNDVHLTAKVLRRVVRHQLELQRFLLAETPAWTPCRTPTTAARPAARKRRTFSAVRWFATTEAASIRSAKRLARLPWRLRSGTNELALLRRQCRMYGQRHRSDLHGGPGLRRWHARYDLRFQPGHVHGLLCRPPPRSRQLRLLRQQVQPRSDVCHRRVPLRVSRATHALAEFGPRRERGRRTTATAG